MASSERAERTSFTILAGHARHALKAAAQGHEGDYTCTTAGTVFKVGATSKILFTDSTDCPDPASLDDGSAWKLKPGSCVAV